MKPGFDGAVGIARNGRPKKPGHPETTQKKLPFELRI